MKIDLFSATAASKKLRDGQATDAYSAGQLSMWIAFVVLLGAIDNAISPARSELAIVHGIVNALVCIVGLCLCYWRNQPKGFVQRFCVLALPISVQMAIAYEAIYWLAYFAYPVFARDLDDLRYEGIWLTLALALSLTMTFLWFVRVSSWMQKSVTP